MPRVICSLPNASDEIDGIKFHMLDDGRRISDEIDEALAARYAGINGYELDEEEREPVKTPESVKEAAPAPKLTKKQQQAAEKAAKEAEDKAKQEAADKEAADKAAQEQADKDAADAAAQPPAAGPADGANGDDNAEVF